MLVSQQALLAHNAKVYLACRTRSKAEEVIAELRTLYPTNEAIFLELDLGNLNSIEKAVKEFLALVVVTTCAIVSMNLNLALRTASNLSSMFSLTTRMFTASYYRWLWFTIYRSGVMGPPIDLTTSDGYDLQFGTNVLGHFYLTKLLLPAIFAASTPTQKARVVTVSSNGAFLTTQIRYELLKDGPERRKVGTMGMYFQSKLVSGSFAII
jgi:retinol dehydrogenase 12